MTLRRLRVAGWSVDRWESGKLVLRMLDPSGTEINGAVWAMSGTEARELSHGKAVCGDNDSLRLFTGKAELWADHRSTALPATTVYAMDARDCQELVGAIRSLTGEAP